MTIDPLETRGFDYHHGIGFAIFAPGVRGELGRGGRYRTSAIGGDAEESTGVTLYLERVLRAIPALVPETRLYVPIQPALLYCAARLMTGLMLFLVQQQQAPSPPWKKKPAALAAPIFLKTGFYAPRRLIRF